MKTSKRLSFFVSAACLAVLVLSLASCNTKKDYPTDVESKTATLKVALKNTLNGVILPAVDGFHSASQELVASAQTFCGNINAANLESLQDQWKVLSLAWSRLVMYNIGPLNDNLIYPKINAIESMRVHGTDYTQTVRNEISARMTDNTALDQAYFDGLSFNKTGMLALEVLIFESSTGAHSTAAADVLLDYQNTQRKCPYLIGMSKRLQRDAAYIKSGWEVSYKGSGPSFKALMLSGTLPDASEPVPALIASVQMYLDYVKNRKLKGNLDAQIAEYFYANALASLKAVETLLEANGQYSFFQRMKNSGYRDAVEQVRTNLRLGKQYAKAHDRANLAIIMGRLDGNFKREIPRGLDVTLGLNFNDGD